MLGRAVLGRRNGLWHGCSNGPFYWATRSGRPALGPLPRKHSCEGVSPYPARWLKGASIITAQHSPRRLPFLLLFLLLPSPPCPVLAPARALSSSSCALPLLRPHRLASGGEKWPSAAGRVPPKSVVTDSYYIVYLRESGGRRTLTIFKSGATASPHEGFSERLRSAVYHVYCFSSEDCFENEDQMAKVIIDAEMFMSGNKQNARFKISKSLPLDSISA